MPRRRNRHTALRDFLRVEHDRQGFDVVDGLGRDAVRDWRNTAKDLLETIK